MTPHTQEDLARAIMARGVRDQRVLRALLDVPRAAFVSPEHTDRAYVDAPLPIPHEQVTTQPSLVAKMVEALGLVGNEHVLEIGTGYGFQTALLAHLSAFVWSIERWPDIAATARTHLRRQGVQNAEVVVGDGTRGLPDHAPFDAIVVSAAFVLVPPPLIEQLAEGGRLVQPIGPGGSEVVVAYEKQKGQLVRRSVVTLAHFVRLYGDHGYPGSVS